MSATALLQRFRDFGYELRPEGDALRVVAERPVTERARKVLSEHKAKLLQELALESVAPYLSAYRDALTLGRLQLCANCSHFDWSADPAALGHCRLFDTESAAFAPFSCPGYEMARVMQP